MDPGHPTHRNNYEVGVRMATIKTPLTATVRCFELGTRFFPGFYISAKDVGRRANYLPLNPKF